MFVDLSASVYARRAQCLCRAVVDLAHTPPADKHRRIDDGLHPSLDSGRWGTSVLSGPLDIHQNGDRRLALLTLTVENH